MNGISSTLKDEIKKSYDKKHKEKFKFLSAIIVTNLLVALLCLPSKESKTPTTKPQKILHPHHQMMLIPLEALVTESGSDIPETPVTLISKNKKIIVEKAWLHEALKSDNDDSQFKIEIPDQQVEHVSANAFLGMIAVPYVEKSKKPLVIVKPKRGSKYEISL